MESWHLSDLPSVRKQQLLVEFSALKTMCPRGVYMCPKPGDPTIWHGVMFIREGPYSSAILRFIITFPKTYPQLPPIVTFLTDMFHPLITPPTTNIYTATIQHPDIVSITDEELPTSGFFSLRHGFPRWFGRVNGKLDNENENEQKSFSEKEVPFESTSTTGIGPSPKKLAGSNLTLRKKPPYEIEIYELISYIRSTFDDENILDQIPLGVAGNPGAWHAWRTYRAKLGINPKTLADDTKSELDLLGPDNCDEIASPDEKLSSNSAKSEEKLGSDHDETSLPPAKKPGEWSWDGVWEPRVKKCVDASISEIVLFGKDSDDDLIHFLHLDHEQLEKIKGDIRKSVEESELHK